MVKLKVGGQRENKHQVSNCDEGIELKAKLIGNYKLSSRAARFISINK